MVASSPVKLYTEYISWPQSEKLPEDGGANSTERRWERRSCNVRSLESSNKINRIDAVE